MFIELSKPSNCRLHQSMGTNRSQSIFPNKLRRVKPVPPTVFLCVHKLRTVPDTKGFGIRVGFSRLQVEKMTRVLEDFVDFHKDTCTKLNWELWIIKGIDSCRTASDVRRSLKHGNVYGDFRARCELLQVKCRRSARSSSTYNTISFLYSIVICGLLSSSKVANIDIL